MSLYLSPYVGLGTQDTPFFPRGLDEPGASAIDLRYDCATRDGQGMRYALLWLPDDIPAPIGAKKLASDHGEPISKVALGHCESLRCQIDFSKSKTIEDAVETLMLRPTRGHWGGLRPYKGMLEAWLGSSTGLKRWVHLPVIAGMTTATDNFNRADENPITGNWSTPATGSSPFKIVSNQLVGQNTGDNQNYSYWSGDVFSNDQFSQIQMTSYISGSPGLTVRGSGNQRDYFGAQKVSGTGVEIFKYVAGAYTSLQTNGYTWPVNDYLRLVATGTTLTLYGDASSPPTTQIETLTDATFSSGSPGVYNFFGAANTFDNWSGGDLGPIELDVTGSGGVTFAGSAPIAFTLVHTPSGGIVFAGTAPVANGKVLVGSGGITFSGHAVVLKNGIAIAIRRAFRTSRWFRNQ